MPKSLPDPVWIYERPEDHPAGRRIPGLHSRTQDREPGTLRPQGQGRSALQSAQIRARDAGPRGPDDTGRRRLRSQHMGRGHLRPAGLRPEGRSLSGTTTRRARPIRPATAGSMSPAESDISSRRPPTKRGRVEGMDGYIPAALVAPILADAEPLCDDSTQDSGWTGRSGAGWSPGPWPPGSRDETSSLTSTPRRHAGSAMPA